MGGFICQNFKMADSTTTTTTLTTTDTMGEVVKVLQKIRNISATKGGIRIKGYEVLHTVETSECPQDPQKVLDLIMLLLGFVYTNGSGSIVNFQVVYNLEVEKPQQEASPEADTAN